ncbi:MAG: hypothetical protein ACOC1O_00765 [bacterium]
MGEIKQILKENNITLQDDDVLYHRFDPGYDDGDTMRDPMYDLLIYRKRLETDEEFEKRKERIKEAKEKSRQNRYARYLELKKEFESEDN